VNVLYWSGYGLDFDMKYPVAVSTGKKKKRGTNMQFLGKIKIRHSSVLGFFVEWVLSFECWFRKVGSKQNKGLSYELGRNENHECFTFGTQNGMSFSVQTCNQEKPSA
ncbi:hypothetical protein H0E87_022002, partial [Populus deltoides]